MKKNSVILKVLHDFLSMFNLFISEIDKEYLSYILCSGQPVTIYDDLSPLGRVFIKNDEVIVQVMFKDYFISAIGKQRESNKYCYEYVIKGFNEEKELRGNYVVKTNDRQDEVSVQNEILLFENEQFVAKCCFDTLKDTFKMYNFKLKSSVKYQNNQFYHRNGKFITQINYYNGEFIYDVITPLNTKNIYGCSFISKYNDCNYTDYETEFRRILKEIDGWYFTFLKSQKDLFNFFQENLFENLACGAIKNFSKKQLSYILDIDFKKSSFTYKKKMGNYSDIKKEKSFH